MAAWYDNNKCFDWSDTLPDNVLVVLYKISVLDFPTPELNVLDVCFQTRGSGVAIKTPRSARKSDLRELFASYWIGSMIKWSLLFSGFQ